MRDKDYILEKLTVAADCLASGFGTTQQRLLDAAVGALTRLEPEDFSEGTQDDFNEIMNSLTSVEPIGDEGGFAASTRAMSDEHAREIAHKIVWLLFAVASDL